MGYMKRMSMDVQEYLKEHPEEKIVGHKIHIEVDTFEGRKWIDYKVVNADTEN
jgi:hypothetical protein